MLAEKQTFMFQASPLQVVNKWKKLCLEVELAVAQDLQYIFQNYNSDLNILLGVFYAAKSQTCLLSTLLTLLISLQEISVLICT